MLGERRDQLARIIGGLGDALRAGEQCAARIGERHTARRARQQPGTDARFQALHGATDRYFGYAQTPCSGRKGTQFYHLGKGCKLGG